MNRRILAAVEDLFFASKIRGTAEHFNITVYFARTADALFDEAKADVPSLVILDLQTRNTDAVALAERLKADAQLRAVPIVAFFSHVETELQRRAEAAGIEHVLPRSLFTRRLPDILRGEL